MKNLHVCRPGTSPESPHEAPLPAVRPTMSESVTLTSISMRT